jgi:hypothetical protein
VLTLVPRLPPVPSCGRHRWVDAWTRPTFAIRPRFPRSSSESIPPTSR